MIQTLLPEDLEAHLSSLVEVLQDTVDHGASVGFLPPLPAETAAAYWRSLAPEIAAGSRTLLAALDGTDLLGFVQIAWATKENARHRAEIQKLCVHTRDRRRGLGRRLMEAAEEEALRRGRTLLVLDTRRGDAAETLYRSLGWQEAGIIPGYTVNDAGEVFDSVFFFKATRSSSLPIPSS